MNLTQHANVRAQQRAIPPLVLEWLLAYGKRTRSHGAERVCFDKKARRELARDVGTPVVSQMSRFLNTSVVIARGTEDIITVMWNR